MLNLYINLYFVKNWQHNQQNEMKNEMPSMCLDDQIALVEAGMKFVSEYRDKGLVSAEVIAKELAEGLEVDRSYPAPRRLFSYEAVDESDQQTGEEVFRRQFFFPLMDATFSSLQELFKEMKAFKSDFGFLCGLTCMQESVDMKTLASHCADLANGPAAGDISAFWNARSRALLGLLLRETCMACLLSSAWAISINILLLTFIRTYQLHTEY